MPDRYVQLPNGSYLEWPDGVSADDFKAKAQKAMGSSSTGNTPIAASGGRTATGESAPNDTRNAAQRYLDNLITPDARREEWQSRLRSGVDDFARHVAANVVPMISHPLTSAEGMVSSLLHPEDTAKALAHGVISDYQQHGPVRGTTDLLGTGLGMAATGELGHASGKLLTEGAHALSEPLQAGGSGLIDRAAGSLKSDFKRGAEPGRAYLEGGGTPALTMRGLADKAEAVKETAGKGLGEAYDAASQPAAPQPIRGLLEAPQYDVPLASSPDVTGRLSKPTILQSNRPTPREFPHYGVNAPAASAADLGDIPGEAGEILPPEDTGYPDRANGLGPHEYVGQRAGTRGGSGQPQGVLRTRNPEISGQVSEPSGTPFPVGATRIGAADVRSALLDPVNRLRAVQSGPGGTGASPLLDEYESGIEPHLGSDFTPRSLFDLKRNVAANTRWNDPTMFDLNSVRQQGVGRVGQLLTDAVPETAPLNRVYQGAGNLAERAGSRADTGTPPFTSLVNRGLEGAAGLGLGYMTHNPALAAAPLLLDSIPVKTGAGYLLYQGGKLASRVPNLGPLGAAAGATSPLLLPQGAQ